MYFSEDFVKAIHSNATSSPTEIGAGVNGLIPIQYFNSILKKTDYSFDFESLKATHPHLVYKLNDLEEGICLLGLIPILVKEVQALKAMISPAIVPTPVVSSVVEPPVIERNTNGPLVFEPVFKQ